MTTPDAGGKGYSFKQTDKYGGGEIVDDSGSTIIPSLHKSIGIPMADALNAAYAAGLASRGAGVRGHTAVRHKASKSIVATFEHWDIAQGWIDRGQQIGHWRPGELEIVPQDEARISQALEPDGEVVKELRLLISNDTDVVSVCQNETMNRAATLIEAMGRREATLTAGLQDAIAALRLIRSGVDFRVAGEHPQTPGLIAELEQILALDAGKGRG